MSSNSSENSSLKRSDRARSSTESGSLLDLESFSLVKDDDGDDEEAERQQQRKDPHHQQLSVDNIDLEYLKINHSDAVGASSDTASSIEKRNAQALRKQNARIELLEQNIEKLKKQCLVYQRKINSLNAIKKSKRKSSP
jgi:hypothetical protein